KGKLDFDSRQALQRLKTELAKHKAAAADFRAQRKQYQMQLSQSSSHDKASAELEGLDYQKAKSALQAQLAAQKSTVRGLEDRLKATLATRATASRELQGLASS